ncbi:MAG TPA: TIGR02186 family protein [Xanthobacteraceae bacterium]|nr:TIGR02186 family protein [Xanthobacteraceae bacterium]
MKRDVVTRSTMAAALGAACLLATPATAERLVTSVSTHRVLINSNFSGTELVLFGIVDDAPAGTLIGAYDVVVSVRGPARSYVTRHKERVLGLWVNTDSRDFDQVPSYLAVLSNKPIAEIGSPEMLRRYRIGLVNNVLPPQAGSDVSDVPPEDSFRGAFLRVKTNEGAYTADPKGITFLTPRFFRAAVPIPGTAQTGDYDVETLLIAKGAMLAQQQTAIEVVKTGFEAAVAQEARNHRFFYGLGTALLALITGLIATLLFRYD